MNAPPDGSSPKKATRPGGGKKHQWRRESEPSFMDASKSINALLFSSRRLPEIKRLYRDTQLDPVQKLAAEAPKDAKPEYFLQSSGGKTSSRHLRRRATSHLSQKRHRYPAGRDVSKSDNDDKNNNQEQLPSRHKRRRNRKDLESPHFSWHNQAHSGVDDENRSSESATESHHKVHWMMTHVWHAKRFHMDELWGWKVPLVHTNRGPRSILRLAQTKPWIQDLTWRSQPLVVHARVTKSDVSRMADTILSDCLVASLECLSRVCPTIAKGGVLSGTIFGRGMIHAPDQFPCNAISPGAWRVVQHNLDAESSEDGNVSLWSFYFWVHPSVRGEVLDYLESITEENNICPQNDTDKAAPIKFKVDKGISGGMACIRIAGIHATSLLNSTFGNIGTEADHWDWNAAFGADINSETYHKTLRSIPDGAIFPLSFDSQIAASRADKPEAHINAMMQRIDGWSPETDQRPIVIRNNQMMAVRYRPVAGDYKTNEAVSGWDIWVDPEISSGFFIRLILAGACPIGLAEESQMHIECSPPVLTFPRDYVDTEEGQKYWEGSDPYWRRVRALFDGGWGRPCLPKQPTAEFEIKWDMLVSDLERKVKVGVGNDGSDNVYAENDNMEVSVVTVRGEFSNSFCGMLVRAGKPPDQRGLKSKSNSKRRNRRPVKGANHVGYPQALPKAHEFAFAGECTVMLNKLSLPAILSCHICAIGVGVIKPGSEIHTQDESNYLGVATAGSFSISRGICHGIGMVGASRFLSALSVVSYRQLAVTRERHSEMSPIQLRVLVLTAEKKFEATLSIIQ